jgi:acyl carrier protein
MHVTEPQITSALISILKDLTQDWDMDLEDPIGPATRLVADLSFASIDVIQMVVAIEEHFQRRNLGFDQLLMQDGRYVDDLQVAQVVEFLHQKLTQLSS